MQSNGAIITSERLTSHYGKQPTFLVNKQIFSNPKRSVQANEHHGDDQRQQDVEANVSGHERDNSDNGQNAEHGSVVEGLVEHDDGALAREVEVEPGRKDEEEDDHGDGMPEEAEEHDEKCYGGVVVAEIAEVSSESDHGIVVGEGAGEG